MNRRQFVVTSALGALIQPSSGIVDRSLHPIDIPLHDLAGMILRQPVWKLIGVETPFVTSVYSGMIYFDDLDPGDRPAGIDGIPLFWVEEPFHETVEDWKGLARWMVENGYQETYRADGEASPDIKVLEQLQADRTLTLRLDDICGYGFTRWRQLMPVLKRARIAASPHTWGSGLKTVYVAHLAAALGNHPTIEGVTCLQVDVDFVENRIVDGQFRPSSAPGFGLTLKT